MSTVYLNGEFIPKEDAKISVDDRGFLFADGVYEVTSFYEGVPFYLDRHMARLRRGLSWMRIDYDVDQLPEIHGRLLELNEVDGGRERPSCICRSPGAWRRGRTRFPGIPSRPRSTPSPRRGSGRHTRNGRRASPPSRARPALDPRGREDHRAASQRAGLSGRGGRRRDDAIQVRDGIALEGAHNNFFGVFDGTVVTHPGDATSSCPGSHGAWCWSSPARTASPWRSAPSWWRSCPMPRSCSSPARPTRCIPPSRSTGGRWATARSAR